MRKFVLFSSILVVCLSCTAAFGQAASAGSLSGPLDASQFASMLDSPVQPMHLSFGQFSGIGNAGGQGNIAGLPFNVRSLPVFTRSFTFQGQTFQYTMVGKQPQAGGTTNIDTTYLAISFVFDGFAQPFAIDATGITNNLLSGPDFNDAQYANGLTQFGDAVQRAEFAAVIAPHEADQTAWHTVLNAPVQLTPVTVEVPAGKALLFRDHQGTLLALVDFNFMFNALVNLLSDRFNAGLINVNQLPIFVTHNAVYGSFTPTRITSCCIGGFHTAFGAGNTGNVLSVQTFAFASSLDPDLAAFLFGDPTVFVDVGALSHEISETFNDPFGSNTVPRYEEPGLPFIACDDILETGDPVENLANSAFPVTLGGFTYHPQTEALLQWFSREVPSSAFGGAYSFPGNNLTSPSTACPAGH
jgi:hypothetical protein